MIVTNDYIPKLKKRKMTRDLEKQASLYKRLSLNIRYTIFGNYKYKYKNTMQTSCFIIIGLK